MELKEYSSEQTLDFSQRRIPNEFTKKTKKVIKLSLSRPKKYKKPTLENDLKAMQQVSKMLQRGAITWMGEIGRQY